MLLSFGWFYLCAGIYSSLILAFTFKNQSTQKQKQCAVNGAGKGKPQKGWRGE
jgi:hypothetical protein